jgi:molybdopterin-guanine dinucleotide biosynthesis protein A
VAAPVLARAFAAGERSPRRAAARLRPVVVAGIDAAHLRNANRPEDLET